MINGKSVRNITVSFVAIAALTVIDQITKKWAEQALAGKDVVQVVSDFFIFVLRRNRGAFLSFGDQVPDFLWVPFFVILPIAFLLIFSIYAISKKRENPPFLVLYVLIMSCGIGNLIDRISLGKVTDFMNMGIGPVLRTGIFNVADFYGFIAVCLFVAWWFVERNRMKKTKSKN